MMLKKFRAFMRMLLFCPMFSDGVRVEYLSASGISFQTLDKWVHFVQCFPTASDTFFLHMLEFNWRMVKILKPNNHMMKRANPCQEMMVTLLKT
jgi:hypothetical protein